MSDSPQGRPAKRLLTWAFAALLAAGSSSAASDPSWRSSFDAEIGLARASSTSPLFRFSPEGSLVRLDGRTRLSGTLLQASLSGQYEAALAGDWRWSASSRADSISSRQARDLEFGQVGFDLALRRPLAGGVVGIGGSWQHLWVAREDFRQALAWQLDWVRPFDSGSYVLLVLEQSQQRHGRDFIDLDGVVRQLSVNGRIADPGAGLAGIDVQAGWRRELNRRELPELSLDGRFVRLALDKDLGTTRIAGAMMLHAARYHAPLLEGLQRRREHTVAVEFSAVVDLGDDRSVKLQGQWSRNRAQPTLFDNTYRQFGIGFASSW